MIYSVIEQPHLPTGKVCHLIAGKTLPRTMSDKLKEENIQILYTRPLPMVETSLSNHADLSVCPIHGGKVILAPSQVELKDKLISLGICVIMSEKEPHSPYPNDCALNFLYNNNKSIINSNVHTFTDYTKFISVKQGYVKCSVAPVAQNAIITDDAAIARTASANGFEVCFVEKGDVKLNGYPYGFIGGCCGKIDCNVMAFCGDISLHKNYADIKRFLFNHGVEIYNVEPGQPLLDIGSLIPITQLKG